MAKTIKQTNSKLRQSVSWQSLFLLYFIGTLFISICVYYYIILSENNVGLSNVTITSPVNELRNQELEQKIVQAVDQLSLAAKSISINKPFVDYLESKTNIHQFNRHVLLPRLKSLVSLDYFRYVKVNLNRPCKLWCDTGKCNLKDCKVKILGDPNKCPLPNQEGVDNELANVNTELASDQLDLLIKLFECNDNDDHDAQYVDLLINPERYTGYKGESANRIWRAIYEENCFIRKTHNPFNSDLCYEERLFYEAISGLHSSINIHLCAEYPSLDLIGSFEPNLEEFERRFKGHNDYIENLYTLFLLELRALTVSQPYLLKRVNWPESSTKLAIQDILKVVDKLDTPMFQDLSLKPSHVSHELATHFRNITTTIIDCVACDKCKLWGKVQLRGLGTAFKILSIKDIKKLNLNHQEIVSLINAVARLSHSIRQLDTFKNLILNKNTDNDNSNNNFFNKF